MAYFDHVVDSHTTVRVEKPSDDSFVIISVRIDGDDKMAFRVDPDVTIKLRNGMFCSEVTKVKSYRV